MIIIFLQLWGALFFLLNKIFFSLAERSSNCVKKRKWLTLSWAVFLIALPAWIIIFISENNWIAAFVEAGGAPAMLIGLISALRGQAKAPKWLDQLSKVAVIIGLLFSLYNFGGITSITQMLELFIAAGFLIGTYGLAKNNSQGYHWFIVGNVSCAILMGIEGLMILMIQQIISLIFVMDAYLVNKKSKL